MDLQYRYHNCYHCLTNALVFLIVNHRRLEVKKLAYLINKLPYLINKVPYLINTLPYLINKQAYLSNKLPYLINKLAYLSNKLPYLINKLAYLINKLPYLSNKLSSKGNLGNSIKLLLLFLYTVLCYLIFTSFVQLVSYTFYVRRQQCIKKKTLLLGDRCWLTLNKK